MEFSKEIINVLDYLCGKFGIVIDWTSDNVMPYLEDLCGRYIQYEVYTSIAWCVAFAAIVVVAGLIWGIAKIADNHSRSTSYIPEAFKFIFFGFLAIGVIIWICQAFDILSVIQFLKRQSWNT